MIRRKRDQRVRRFRRQLLAVAPHLDDPKFGPLTQSFARLSILASDIFDHLREMGIVNDDGEIRSSSVDALRKLIDSQVRLADKLHLTPAAQGRLNRDQPFDLAAAMAAEDAVEVSGA